MLWAYRALRAGITTQTVDTFRTTDSCTRSEAVAFISRAKNVEPTGLWNQERGNDPISFSEFSIVMQRAGYTTPLVTLDISVLRWQAVKMLLQAI